jgi:hypothetical protein
LVPVHKQPGLKAGAFSPALLVPVATTGTNYLQTGIEGLLFLAVGAATGHRRCPWRRRRRKDGGARAAGQHRGGWEKLLWCLCQLGPERIRGTRGKISGLSGPTHFEPKSKTEIGARGCVWTALPCLSRSAGPCIRADHGWLFGSHWRCRYRTVYILLPAQRQRRP